MGTSLIDITSSSFWLFVTAATLLVTPITRTQTRQILLAWVNVAFLWFVLGPAIGPAVTIVLLLYFTLQGLAGRYRSPQLLGAILVVISAAFLLHKQPMMSAQLGTRAINPLLALVGFSYIFLRLMDLIRAVWETRQAPSLVALINYLVPFHMLPAGPVVSYQTFLTPPSDRPRMSQSQVLTALERITHGLFKKFVLAYTLRQLFLSDFQSTGWLWFIEVQFFFLWLFLDFSAYSDIAVGVGRLIGVTTPENFDRPYLARNLIDFWDRWHISLSEFIRRNLFIPIQLVLLRRKRHSPLACANVAVGVSFVSCALWHGIGWNFLLWGIVHCVGLMSVNAYRQWLTRRLGAKGVKRYLADWRIRVVATVATYEFVAASLLTLFIDNRSS